AERVAGLGVAHDQIRIIANWADDAVVKPVEHATNPLRKVWGLEGTFVVGYSGNLGRAHDVDTLVDAMVIVENAQAMVSAPSEDGPSACVPIGWLFIGGGALFGRLAAEVARRGLTRVVFKTYQAKDR